MDGKKATRWGLSSRSEHRFSYRTLYSTVLSRGASSSSASKQVPRILLKAKVHNRVHNSLPLSPVLIQINSFHACPTDFLNTYFNTFFHLTLFFQIVCFQPFLHHSLLRTSPLVHTYHFPRQTHLT